MKKLFSYLLSPFHLAAIALAGLTIVAAFPLARALAASETVNLDTALYGIGTPNTSISSIGVLQNGVPYQLSITGNWSAWPPFDVLTKAGHDATIYESPSVPGPTQSALDASYRYDSGIPQTYAGVYYSVDGGTTFNPLPRPQTDVYNPAHSYTYIVTGTGSTVAFRTGDTYGDDHGVMQVTVKDVAPVITVGGTVTATGGAGPVVVAPGLTITGPGNENITGATVSIGAGFQSAEDSLGIQSQGGSSGTISGLSWSYNSGTGVLTLSGAASPATYQAAMRLVTYADSVTLANTSPRTITFSIATQLPFPGNGHFYQFVSANDITWTDAQTAAAGDSLYGIQGYLATITSSAENDFIKNKLQGNGWLGSNDVASTGHYQWVTGPEAGTTYCIATSDGNSVPQNGDYTNWDNGEPNNLQPLPNGEHYVHMLGNPGFGTARIGKWNNLPNAYPMGSLYTPLGYVVEYGGMPGDPALQLTGLATVNILQANHPPTVNADSASITTNEGTAATNTGSYNDQDAGDNVAITVNTGTVTKTGTNTGTWSWSFPTTDGPSQSQTVTVTANDGNGHIVTTTFGLTVNNVAPMVTLPTSQSASEGMSQALSLGSFSDPGINDFPWTADVAWGDNSPDTVFTINAFGPLASQNHVYPDEGSYTMKVSVTDKDGAAGSATSTVNISDAALTAGPAHIIAPTEGLTFSGTIGSFTDANTAATIGDFTATIAWGDSTTSAGVVSGSGGSFTVSGSHTYADEGSYAVSIAVNDKGGISTMLSGTAAVSDAPLMSSSANPPNSNINYNGTIATFTDANPGTTAADFTVLINWGDSTVSAGIVTGPTGGRFTVSGSHTYTSTGFFTITVAINDDGGSKATTSSTVLIYASAPGGGSFVIGDKESTNGTAVTFWGAQWSKINTLSSGGSAPSSFKGFAQSPATPVRGTAWSADPGNSTPSPQGTLPAYMGVIVTSTAAKSGPNITGDSLNIVIVQTNPGYDANPGHAGTGTVIQQAY